jgi:segregation and condensation protein B
MSENQKHLIEALLFATPEGLTQSEISGRTKISESKCKTLLKQIQKHKVGSGVEVVLEGNKWKMRIRKDLMENVRHITSIQSEFDSSFVKTLAVIALKAPVKQSEIIHLRGNKAYDHVAKLEEQGFIVSKPHSRTKLLSLKQKFYDYFDIKKGGERYLFEQK